VTYTQSVVLGVVQGLTEFLPISSSGHLILIPRLFGWPDQGLAFDAAIHLGTLAALLLYFWPELVRMARAVRAPSAEHAGFRRLAGLLLVATIPAGLAGLLLEAAVESHLRAPWLVAASLTGWALVMLGADRQAGRRQNPTKRPEDVGWGPGLAVGMSQALALIPGTSRSAITITAGLLVKMDRAAAARFSFLLGIPITAAAGGAKMLDLLSRGLDPNQAGLLLVGLMGAFVSGLGAVWFLVRYLERRSLLPFVLYRLGLGLVILGTFGVT
jgi:undecaprenyl-diphosphatase